MGLADSAYEPSHNSTSLSALAGLLQQFLGLADSAQAKGFPALRASIRPFAHAPYRPFAR
jgi:hypothetical protein